MSKDQNDFLAQIEQRLAALEARLSALADQGLIGQVQRAIEIARVDQPFALVKARFLLEKVVGDIYRRELPQEKPKPLFDMIGALQEKGIFSKRVTTDLDYIRIKGNLILHPGDELLEASDREIEVILLLTINLVEWYLTGYLPEPVEGRGESPPLPPCPYRGLLAFGEADSTNYFGREPDVADVLDALEHQPLVTVVGPSGSGKSSLAFAGIAAALRSSPGWAITAFRPRARPYGELAQALVSLWETDPVERLAQATSLAKHWAAGEIPLGEALRESLRQSQAKRLLLIADQFEELYTQGLPAEQIQDFLDLLTAAIEEAIPRPGEAPALCLLLTLRADFLGHALGHQGLAAAMDRYPKKLLGPVDDPQRLRAIIEQPARQAGVVLEELLVERILRDLAQLPGEGEQSATANLPLLEFTLEQLWERQQERRLTHLGYEELGGIQQALTRHANALYQRLDEQERSQMRQILVQLVRPGEGTEDTRQVATRGQLRPEHWPLVTRLADQRLIVTDHDQASDQDTAELIHEALIRHWPPLRQWIDQDRAFRTWQNRLRQALADWQASGKETDDLLRGARLAEAEERLAAHTESLSVAEQEYIAASLADRERQRRERQRLQRRISVGLAAFLIVALLLSAFAGRQWWIADERGKAVVQTLDEAMRSKALADEQLIQAKHNLGLVFAEKAEQMLAQRDNNAAHFYLLYALANLKPSDSRAEILGRLPYTAARYPTALHIGLKSYRGGSTHEFAFSPEGRTVAAPLDDSSFGLWDVPSGELRATFTGHTGGIDSISFAPDGKSIASGSRDGSVRLWDVASATLQVKFTGHAGIAWSLAFSSDGKTLASGAGDKIQLWDVASATLRAELSGHTGAAVCLHFSPNGEILASGSYLSADGRVLVWDVDSGALRATLSGHTDAVISLGFSPDGKILATGSVDRSIRLWDMATRSPRAVLSAQAPVSSLDFSSDGKTLASGSDQSIRLWDVDSATLRATLTGQSDTVAVGFSQEDKTLVSASRDGSVRLWNLASGALRSILTSTISGSVDSIGFAPDGETIASGYRDGSVRLWDMATGLRRSTLTGHAGGVSSLRFAPDGQTLTSASLDGSIRLWDVDSGTLRSVLKNGHTPWLKRVSVSPDGKILASVSWREGIRLWDVATGSFRNSLSGNTGQVESMSFAPDGKILAIGLFDGSIDIWDVVSGTLRATLRGHTDGVRSLRFSNDGNTLASGSDDRSIRLWDITTGNPRAKLMGHRDAVISLSFSPDGKILSSGSWDGLWLWDVATGAPRAALTGQSHSLNSLSFAPDGKTLAWGGSSFSVRLWDFAEISSVFAENDFRDLITQTEKAYRLRMQDIDLQPFQQETNLDGAAMELPRWSDYHPLRWLPAAEGGDADAMVQLGIIYHRDAEWEQAELWYRKAADAGNKDAKQRLIVLDQTRMAAGE